MFTLLIKSFVRTKIFVVSLILLLTVGAISIFIGKQFLVKQQKAIVAAEQFQEKSIERNLEYHPDDLGLLLYYLRFTLVKQPTNIGAISIGQSDVNPVLQAVTIRGLEGQKYDTDFENPSLLMSGNLDLGFVIIYLFPLVLIAMTFNIYSEEEELGTWRILAVQTKSKMVFLLKKIGVRMLFLFVLLIALLLLASITLQIPIDLNFAALFAQSSLYLVFWCALCTMVISYQKSSSFNAVGLITIWVVLTILVPAMVNNYVLNKYPVPEALHAMVEQRDGYHEKWDLEKDATMDGFLEAYPQYKKYPVPEDEFTWLWYYGMQHMGDLESKETSLEMKEKILMRNKVSEKAALLVPTLHAQLSFNKLAGTDMVGHLDFLDALTEFHERLRLGFYTFIFEEQPANVIDWSKYEPEYFKQNRSFSWSLLLLPTFILSLVLGSIGVLKLKRI